MQFSACSSGTSQRVDSPKKLQSSSLITEEGLNSGPVISCCEWSVGKFGRKKDSCSNCGLRTIYRHIGQVALGGCESQLFAF